MHGENAGSSAFLALLAAWCSALTAPTAVAESDVRDRATDAAPPRVLLAQAVPDPVPGAPGRDAGATPPVPAGREQPQQPAAGFEWTLAPVRWGGNLAAEVRSLSIGDQPRRLQQVETANIRAATYLWQPWFAQLGGGLGVVTSKERNVGNEGVTSVQAPAGNSSTATGNGTLSVFPVSRFPFNAYFDVSDSRASGEVTRSDFVSTRLGLRQNYRPLEGNANYVASYDRSVLDSAAFGRDTVDALAGSMNRQFGAQSIDVSGSQTRNQRSATQEGSLLNRLTARHGYRPCPALSVDSLASVSSNDFRLQNGGVVNENNSRFVQMNSLASWLPGGATPWHVTGGGRVFQSVTDVNGIESESRSIGANAAASYQWSRNASFFGNATVTQASSNTQSDLFTSQGAGLTYSADPAPLGSFVYLWNATGNALNQTGGQEGARQNVAGQAGHNLTRNWPLAANSMLTLGLGQSYGALYDTVTTAARTLSHNASVAWRVAPSASTSAYTSLLAADSRTTGYNENDFQLVNLQASGQVQFDRYASSAANLTLQGTRQSTPAQPASGFNYNSSGNLSYQHQRAFGVPRLRYLALYSINDTQFKSRLLGDVNAPREQVTQSFEQRLDYNIGRIEMRLTARLADIEGQRNALVFFRVSRQFGNF